MAKNPKRPRDVSQLANMIVEIASGERVTAKPDEKQKDPAAVARGRAGGLKGGKARALVLPSTKRKAIATKAAQKRWDKS